MWLKSKHREVMNVQMTPGDYILALEEIEDKGSVLPQIKAAVEQIRTFEKRQNDVRFICYRDFKIDDSLTRTNLVVDGMTRRFYETILQMKKCLEQVLEEKDRQQKIDKLIDGNDTIIEDLKSLLTYLLKVQEDGQKTSLSEIEDVVSIMEEEYRKELTKI